MRIISYDMVEAVSNKRNFKRSNTQVIVTENQIDVYLFGNNIYTEIYHGDHTTKTFRTCGYETVTTKERLNALLGSTAYIYQRNYQWYISQYVNGEDIIIPMPTEITFTFDRDGGLISSND